jgi:hypothetical protein
MKVKKVSLVISSLVAVLTIVASLVGCLAFYSCSEGLKMTGDPIEVEGRVDITEGGTVEGPIHSWYVLRDCWWVQQRKGTVTPLNIDGLIDPKYLGKRLRINGRVYSELSGDRLRYFIHVYSLTILNQQN